MYQSLLLLLPAYTMLGIIGKPFPNIEQSLEILVNFLKETEREKERERERERQMGVCHLICVCIKNWGDVLAFRFLPI